MTKQIKQDTLLKEVGAFELKSLLAIRSNMASHWLVKAAKTLSLPQRRKIVQDIKDGTLEAQEHQDIDYGAKLIRKALIHDLWPFIKKQHYLAIFYKNPKKNSSLRTFIKNIKKEDRDLMTFANNNSGYFESKPVNSTSLRGIQGKIDDFSVWAAVQSPAHKGQMQKLFAEIVPEDACPLPKNKIAHSHS